MDVKEPWNNRDESYFIDLVHQYPPLWNTADKNYAVRRLKDRLYAQVIEELKRRCPNKKLTTDSARRKFCRLRSYFYQELRKKKMHGDLFHPKWIHFDRMLFLVKEDERKKIESDLKISLVNDGTKNDNTEKQHGGIVPETNSSDSNEGTGSLVSLQLSNEDSEPPLKQISQNTSSSAYDFPKTETPMILRAWSTSESDDISDHTVSRPSVQSCEDSEPPVKQKRPNTSSPMCDSSNTDRPVVLKASSTSDEGPPAFNVALGNLVVASLNQMPAEKANAATKEIFNVLLKYGNESNHRR